MEKSIAVEPAKPEEPLFWKKKAVIVKYIQYHVNIALR